VVSTDLQPAWVLHVRPWRETGLLADLLTLTQGRVRVLFRGARRGKQRQGSLLQPFVPLLAGLKVRTGLAYASRLEAGGPPLRLQGTRLYCGFYVNELLQRLLAEPVACERIFSCYSQLLADLLTASDVEPLLRQFERVLLEALGYALVLTRDAETQQPLCATQRYVFVPGAGLRPAQQTSGHPSRANIFDGAHLLAFAAGDYSDNRVRQVAKRLMRQALAPLLGPRPLKSRELFHKEGWTAHAKS
jgi:DNA repair protein RecO (recombination protein O)